MTSINVTPRNRNVFGELIDGELVLKGFLFRVFREDTHKGARSLIRIFYDHPSLERLDEILHFLPIVEFMPEDTPSPGVRRFGGLCLRPIKTGRESVKRVFERIGYHYARVPLSSSFDEYATPFLDSSSQKRLLELHSPAQLGEEIVII